MQLLPLWIFRYFPSQDGPSHLFNSYVFAKYAQVPGFEQAFTLQVPTAGNLTGQGLAILFLELGIPAEFCEKLLVTICIVGLAAAFHYAAAGVKSAHSGAAFLVLPFLYNWPLQMGFWSFSLGVPFLLICIGFCLRHGGNWNIRNTALLFVTIAAVYACHPIDWAACGVAVGLLTISAGWKSLIRGPNKGRAVVQTLIPFAVFVPFVIPNLLFAERNQSMQWGVFRSIRLLLWPIYTASPEHLFNGDRRAAQLLFVVLLTGSIVNVSQRAMRRRTEYADMILATSAVLFAMGLAVPDRIGEGSYLEVRFLLFGYLLWALWVATTLTRRAMRVTIPAIAALSIWLVLSRVPEWRMFSDELAEIAQASSVIEPNSTVCQLDFSNYHWSILPMAHAIDLVPQRQFIDIRDYEAGRFAFWTRFRPGYYFDEDYLSPTPLIDFEGKLQRFESRTGKKLDYIVLTSMTASPAETLRRLLPSLASRYELVRANGPAVAVYRVRD